MPLSVSQIVRCRLPLADDLGEERSAASGRGHHLTPRTAIAKHRGYRTVPGLVLWPAFVQASRLGTGRTFRLAATPILIVFARDGREHVEHHAVDGREHAPGEFVGMGRKAPRGREIERDDPDLLGIDRGAKLGPVRGRETR